MNSAPLLALGHTSCRFRIAFVVRYRFRSLGFQIVEKFLILQALLFHSTGLELEQKLLDVFLSLLLGFSVPWVQLLAEALIFGIFEQSLLNLTLSSCLLFRVHVLIEVEIEELLLNTLLQFVSLLDS